MQLILNSSFEHTFAQLQQHSSHAILLTGSEGVGLGTIAKAIAGKSLAGILEPTDNDGLVNHEKGSVRIGQIRELYDATKTKRTAPAVFIIDDANTMGHPAQNALLKLLEEPNRNIAFILTCHDPSQLLPTIRSRVQTYEVPNISTEQTKDFIQSKNLADNKKVQQLIYMGAGRPALLSRLVNNEKLFEQYADIVRDARTLLQGTTRDKMVVISNYSSDREKAMNLLQSAITIIHLSLIAHPSLGLIETSERLSLAYDRLAMNGNVRLQLLSSMV